MQIASRQPYKVLTLRTVQDVLTWGEFLTAGWQTLVSPASARCEFTLPTFFKRVLSIATGSETEGAVLVFTSINDKPLGFVILANDSENIDEHESVLIYAGYSTGKYVDAAPVSMEIVERWARTHGYGEIHATTRRLNGAATRLFRKKLGFDPMCIVYRKVL